MGFSPDERWALSIVYGPPGKLLLLPVGAGKTVELPNPEKLTIQAAAFMPDGRRVVFLGGRGNDPLQLLPPGHRLAAVSARSASRV